MKVFTLPLESLNLKPLRAKCQMFSLEEKINPKIFKLLADRFIRFLCLYGLLTQGL